MARKRKKRGIIQLWDAFQYVDKYDEGGNPDGVEWKEVPLFVEAETRNHPQHGHGIFMKFDTNLVTINFTQLNWLSQRFGTKVIDFETRYDEGCPTCGGSKIIEIIIYKITRNFPKELK